MGRMRSVRAKVLYSTGIVVLGLAALVAIKVSATGSWEASAHLASFDCSCCELCRGEPGVMVDHDALGQPFTVQFNEMGYRGLDPGPQTGARADLEVQLYGDSMIYGIGLQPEQTIARCLKRQMEADPALGPTRVVNFGMPMNYLVSNLNTYEHFGRQRRPDIVVFAYAAYSASTFDINARATQMRATSLSRWLSRRASGQWLLQTWQRLVHLPGGTPGERAALRAKMGRLLADQRERGTRVVFYSFFDDFEGLDDIVPEGLTHLRLSSHMSLDAYRRSHLIIAGDGHPDAAGAEFFAQQIFEGLRPLALEAQARRRGLGDRTAAGDRLPGGR